MNKNKILDEKDCIIFEILNVLSKRWNTFILLEFSKYQDEFIQYNKLKLSLNKITARSLSQRLKELEDWKIIKKKEIKENNIKKTYYKLTSEGKLLLPKLVELRDWAKSIKHCKLEKECNKCDFIGSCRLFNF